MARSDWAALLTEPAQEYLACSELFRFGFTPYLPQLKKRHHTRAGAYVMRHYPLFPRYLFLPIGDTSDPSIRLARGVARRRPVLTDDDGRPWRAPNKVIETVREAERIGRFDEILHKDDSVTLAYGVLAAVRSVMVAESHTGNIIHLLMPLFGGARATVSAAKVVHV